MKKVRIAQFGTYDIESLGDTMFPKMFQYGISQYIETDITLFSMTEKDNPYNGNSHVYSFDQFEPLNDKEKFDLIVIGGGEFIHFKPMDIFIDGKHNSYPSGYIWKKPIELARKHEIDVVINCVGVPYDFDEEQQLEIKEYLEFAKIISVRDIYSKERLIKAGINSSRIKLVADNNWYFNRVYSKDELSKVRESLTKKGCDLSSPYVIAQYGTTYKCDIVAEQLEQIMNSAGLKIYLLPVNYCHEDREGLRLIAEYGKNKIEMIDTYFQPIELMAVISGAELYIGTSLHGNLTAASYGVKNIGIDMYPDTVGKMDGIFDMMGLYNYLVPTVYGISSAYKDSTKDNAYSDMADKIDSMQIKLDDHFREIVELINSKE